MFRGLALFAGLTAAVACGPVVTTAVPVTGDPCYEDADCVPNGCCGKGTAIVSRANGPNCSTVTCDGGCPVTGIKCGCAVPVCHELHCTAAISTSPGC